MLQCILINFIPKLFVLRWLNESFILFKKRLSDRYKDHERHWFVDWMITEDGLSMSKYTFKNFAIVDGIPFDEYTNDKAKWYKKKTKESYPDISKFITYPDNIDEMHLIWRIGE